MAARAHMSYSHFRRLFKRYFHHSPHNYVLHGRMNAAGRELRKRGSRGVQVKEVAILAGYEDPAEFSRAFRKYMGVSPTQFRSALG
jgi:AraC family transcriptional regulator